MILRQELRRIARSRLREAQVLILLAKSCRPNNSSFHSSAKADDRPQASRRGFNRQPLRARQYDGAVYLCGYAIELALKARKCQTLKWEGYPETNNEFQAFQSFRTHSFETLLTLSGQKERVRNSRSAQWSVVREWNPEIQYRAIGSATEANAAEVVAAVRELLRIL